MTPPKTPTKAERALDLWLSLFGAAVAVNAGLAALDHHWRGLAAVGFTLGAWIVTCAAIETKKGQP